MSRKFQISLTFVFLNATYKIKVPSSRKPSQLLASPLPPVIIRMKVP